MAEIQKRARRNHDEVRAALVEKQKYHLEMANRFSEKIAEHDKPKMPRFRKPSITSVVSAAKDDFSPEELLEILETAKRKKMEMKAE